MNAKEILRILKKNGFVEKSQTGSHLKLVNGNRIAVVPMHGKKDVPIGTLKSIEKQSGIKF